MKLTIAIAVLGSTNAALAQVGAWGQCGGVFQAYLDFVLQC
jgi:hypothetical protein